MRYLAHSARPNRGIPEQGYRDHIENVVGDAVGNADRAAAYSAKFVDLLRATVRLAAEFHDLGKLDETNQEVLRTNRGQRLKLNHVDAGVAHLLRDVPRGSELLAAVSVFSHHIGLPAWAFERTRGAGRILRDTELAMGGVALNDLTNQRLDVYRKRHGESVHALPPISTSEAKLAVDPLLWRLALSCLVSRGCGSL